MMFMSYVTRLLAPHLVVCLAVYVGCATMPTYTFEHQSWPICAKDEADLEAKLSANLQAEARNEAMNRTWITAGLIRLVILTLLAAAATLASEYWTGCWDFRHGCSDLVVGYLLVNYLIAIFFALGNTISHGAVRAAGGSSLLMLVLVLGTTGARHWFPAFLRWRQGART
jgi:hypothetical protein